MKITGIETFCLRYAMPYALTYARPDRLIRPEQVTVSAARSGLTVRGIPVRAPGNGAKK